MTQTAYPKVGVATSDDQFRDLFRLLADSGVLSIADLAVIGDSSGMQVKVASGMGIADGIVAKNSAQVILPIGTAPGAGLSRVDTVVEQLDYTQDPIVQLKVIPGAAAPTGTQEAPSLAPAGTVKYNLPLGDVLVGPSISTIPSTAVTDRRSFVGTNVRTWTAATRPSSPRAPQIGLNTTTGRWEYWTGSAWADVGLDAAQLISGTIASARLPITPISKGGTGATTKADARAALGIFVQSSPLTAANDVNDIRLW